MKTQLKYGVAMSIVLAILIIVDSELIGFGSSLKSVLFIVQVLVFGTGLFFGMKETRKVSYKDDVNYGQAMFSGLTIGLIVAILLGLINSFYFGIMNQNYAERVIKEFTIVSGTLNLSKEAIALQIKEIKNTYTPFNQFMGTFLFFSVLGIVLSSVFSMILRTKDTFTQITKPKE
jgi:hypothetical protein